MKISRLSRIGFVAALACSFAIAVSGCMPTLTPQTPTQIATNVCGPAKAEIAVLQVDGVFTGGAANTLATIQSDLSKGCDAILTTTAPVLTANLSNLSSVTFPLLLDVVSASNLSDSDKATARDIVVALQSTLALALSMEPASQ